ncbi:MAG TPA: hypothetical protein VFD36_29385 [Kofleriaceae bacterium]|nr:hypothetical protein [Kofleriaceae bacterium]
MGKKKDKEPKTSRVQHLMDTETRIAQCDRHQPSAWGARPLYRLRLVNPDSHIGFLLLDVIAVLQERNERGFVVPMLYCLGGGGADGWTDIWIRGEDAHDVSECYEVVS